MSYEYILFHMTFMEVYMIVNKGFSFSNIVGEYKITTNTRGIITSEADDFLRNLSDDEIYGMYEITTTYTNGALKEIYSPNSFDEGSIAFIFAEIDIHDSKSILKFCHTYGLLYSDKLLQNRTSDYIFFQTSKNSFAPVVPTREPDTILLSQFCRTVIDMRILLNMISAINENNYVTMIETMIYMCFHPAKKLSLWLDIPSGIEHEDFRLHFLEYVRTNSLFELPLQQQIDSYLAELEHYIHLSSEYPEDNDFDFDYDYDFAFHSLGQYLLSLFQHLQTIISIDEVSEEGMVSYSGSITNEYLKQNININHLSLITNAFIVSMLNFQLRDINPEVRFENGELIGDWNVSTLQDAMFLEIFLSLSPNNRLKKCSNPTCNSFFDVTTGNDRKIYCSTRCATLMAKRKQRERDKLQK